MATGGAIPDVQDAGPLGSLAQHLDALKRLEVPHILYCETSGRARTAHGLLSQHGVCGSTTPAGSGALTAEGDVRVVYQIVNQIVNRV